VPAADVQKVTGRGRPSRAGCPTRHLALRLTDDERSVLAAAAAVERKSLADYARDVLLSESADLLEAPPAGQLRTP